MSDVIEASPTPTTTTPASANSLLTGDLSPKQAEQMIGWTKQDLLKGKLSPEKANDIFNQLGATEVQRGPDTRTPAEVEIDRADPPAKPEDYLVRWKDPNDSTPTSQQDRQADATVRGWLADAGFPREIGNSLVTTIAKVAQTTKGFSAAQLEAYRLTELAKLGKVHGDKLTERLAAADDMIASIESQRPGLLQFLGTHGVGRSAMVWNMLIQRADMYHQRKAAKGK